MSVVNLSDINATTEPFEVEADDTPYTIGLLGDFNGAIVTLERRVMAHANHERWAPASGLAPFNKSGNAQFVVGANPSDLHRLHINPDPQSVKPPKLSLTIKPTK